MSVSSVATPGLAVTASVAFACFAWGTLRHFVREGAGSIGAWMISLFSWVLILQFLWRVSIDGASTFWVAALILILGAIAAWAWTVRWTRSAPPTLAYTEDTPHRLYDGGPYRWVRHPFYTSYLLCWIGTALGSRGPVGWCFAAAICAVYVHAARHEEAKFAKSPFAGDYMAYRRRTGMFLPRVGGAA